MKFLFTAIAYLIALLVIAAFAFLGTLLLAGPHGGLLPRQAGPGVLIVAWLIVLVAPVLIARLVWKRLVRSRRP